MRETSGELVLEIGVFSTIASEYAVTAMRNSNLLLFSLLRVLLVCVAAENYVVSDRTLASV